MLRISRSQAEGSPTTLRLEGRLTRASLAEFRAACAPYLDRPGALHLDLSGLIYLDEPARRELRRLLRSRVPVHNCSPFIRELLARPQTSSPGST